MRKRDDRKFWTGMVLGALVAAGTVVVPDLVSGVAGAQSAGAAGVKDVVLVRCRAAHEQFQVSAYQGSTSTPARRTDSCADTLGDLTKAGFAIDSAGYSDDADFAIFTVTR